MRRPILLIALLATCVLVAGCGGDDEPEATPLGDALGYFARDVRFVAAIETDPDGDQVERASELAGRFPADSLVGTRIRRLTRFRSVDFDADVRPLLRHELVVGVVGPRPRARGSEPPVVAALRVPDPRRAKRFILRQSGFIGSGKANGVRIFENDDDARWVAVDGDVLLIATYRDALVRAIATRRGEDHMTEPAFADDVKGLADGALVRVSADPRAVIADSARARPALRVKWVGALRRLGATLKLLDNGIAFELRAKTDAGALDNGDLPLSPKPGPIPLVGGRADIKAGMREPARLARLLSELWPQLAPRRAARARQVAAGRIDWRRVLRHLGDVGVVAVNPFTRSLAARVEVIEPRDVRDGLEPIAPALRDVAPILGFRGVGMASPEPGENFYALATPRGGTLVFGVIGSALVAATEARRAADLLSEPTRRVRGAPAAAVLTLNARDLVGEGVARALGGAAAIAAPLVLAPLRDLTARATIDEDRLRVSAKLTIVR